MSRRRRDPNPLIISIICFAIVFALIWAAGHHNG